MNSAHGLLGLDLIPMERQNIERLMPHAPSWVMIDRVIECCPPTFIRTQKQVDKLDPFVIGHFIEGPPLLPGALLIEYVSQSAYLLSCFQDQVQNEAPPVRLLARCNASFLSPALGGDLLTADVYLLDCLRDVWVFEGTVFCDDRVVCRVKVFASSSSHQGRIGFAKDEVMSE
jgi:3-hydroxymyristoyl/3-hydroxydecanoyl-(acyl carrier protein) dehydratase